MILLLNVRFKNYVLLQTNDSLLNYKFFGDDAGFGADF